MGLACPSPCDGQQRLAFEGITRKLGFCGNGPTLLNISMFAGPRTNLEEGLCARKPTHFLSASLIIILLSDNASCLAPAGARDLSNPRVKFILSAYGF